MPAVVVEIAPPSAPSTLTRALLDACSSAVRDGRCDLASDEPPAKSVAVAIVGWDEPGERHARIQVGVRRDTEPEWRTRSLDFKSSDARIERWRSVGLTIATLAGELVPEPASKTDATDAKPDPSAKRDAAGKTDASAAPVGNDARAAGGTTAAAGSAGPSSGSESATGPKSPKPTERSETDTSRDEARAAAAREDADAADARPDDARREHARPSAPASLWAGVSAMVGPGLDDGPWRVGGGVDVGWRPTRVPLFARATFGFAARPVEPDSLSVQWQTATVGAGAVIGGRTLALEPRIAVGVAGLRVRVKDDRTQRQDSGSQWQATLGGGADLVWLTSTVGLVASVEAWRAPATTQILLANRVVAADLAAGWALGLGARVVLE